MNTNIYNYALAQLKKDKNGELILPIRKRIWLSFGEIKKSGDRVLITSGMVNRIHLAQTCVEKNMYLWNNEFGKKNELTELLDCINFYIDKKKTFGELESMRNICNASFWNLAYNPKYEIISLIGLAGIYVSNIALYDDLLLQETKEEELDDLLDPFSWDASYLSSLVYAAKDNGELIKDKRIEFWKWYLEMAKMIGKNSL